MKCTYCSTPVPDGAVFCHQCGSLVSDAEGQAAASASLTDSGVRNLTTLLREDTKGEFEIIRQIGRGGMAVVFLAREIHLDRQVAIKVLPPELTFGHGIERFKREAKTAASLDHPNIIPIHRIASGGLIFWYTMKFVEGQSLEQILRDKKRMSLQEAVRILRPVADALQYAHAREVVHRDVKPANVMIDAGGRVMVTDFGIAKAFREVTLTASGTPVGTPHYMSPEQATGLPVSHASDQYSLGIMTYRMLSGQVPFDGTSAVDILHKQCTLPPPPLNVLRANLPNYVYRTVEKSLAKNPGERFSSVKAFAEALGKDSPELAGWSPTPYAPRARQGVAEGDSRPHSRGFFRGLTWGIGIVGVIAAAGFALWYFALRGDVGGAGAIAAGNVAGTAASTDSVGDSLVQDLSAAAARATLTLADLPDGAVVRVDGRRMVGSEFELEAGQHMLSIAAAGYETITDEFTLVAGERLRFPFRAREITRGPTAQRPQSDTRAPTPGFLRIGCRPWANVLIDGQLIEQVTARLDTLAPGEYNLRFERPGFVTVDTTVTVRTAEVTAVVIQLTQGTT